MIEGELKINIDIESHPESGNGPVAGPSRGKAKKQPGAHRPTTSTRASRTHLRTSQLLYVINVSCNKQCKPKQPLLTNHGKTLSISRYFSLKTG